jgi:magnesium-transporting ATPase (P-type)
MEQPGHEKSLFGLQIDEKAKEHLRKMASWAIVIVIVAIAGYLISIFTFISTKSSVTQREGFSISGGSTKNLSGLVLQVVIGLLICYFLFQFANFAKKGVDNSSQPDIEKSFSNLKIYFAFIGVLLLIALILVFFGILLGGI